MASFLMCSGELAEAYGRMRGAELLCASSGLWCGVWMTKIRDILHSGICYIIVKICLS